MRSHLPKVYLASLVLLVVLSGCDLFGGDDRLCCALEEPLLPLTVGSERVFSRTVQDSVQHATVRVARTDTVDGRPYFVVENGLQGQTMRVRSDEQNRIYQLQEGSEHLWLDPTVPTDGSYSYAGPSFDYTVRVTRNVTVEIPDATYENGVQFSFDDPDVVDEEYAYTLVPGVGIVRYSTVSGGSWLYHPIARRQSGHPKPVGGA